PVSREQSADRVQLLFRLIAPPNTDKLRLSAKRQFDLLNAWLDQAGCVKPNGEFVIEFAPAQLAPRETHVIMEKGAFPISFGYTVKADATPRPLAFASFLSSWAPTNHAIVMPIEEKFGLSGGDFERGRDLFFSDQLKCS